MRAILTRFVKDQSGEVDFYDPVTAIVIGIGSIGSIYFLMHTLGGVFDAVGGLVGAAIR
jgi:Flp pilus assembly pilin Flp